jgi:hypothetical protein
MLTPDQQTGQYPADVLMWGWIIAAIIIVVFILAVIIVRVRDRKAS